MQALTPQSTVEQRRNVQLYLASAYYNLSGLCSDFDLCSIPVNPGLVLKFESVIPAIQASLEVVRT